MTKDQLSELYELAQQATSGWWIAAGVCVENTRDHMPDIVCQIDEPRGPDDSRARREADARYIAAAQPNNIKALIAEIRALRRLLPSD